MKKILSSTIIGLSLLYLHPTQANANTIENNLPKLETEYSNSLSLVNKPIILDDNTQIKSLSIFTSAAKSLPYGYSTNTIKASNGIATMTFKVKAYVSKSGSAKIVSAYAPYQFAAGGTITDLNLTHTTKSAKLTGNLNVAGLYSKTITLKGYLDGTILRTQGF